MKIIRKEKSLITRIACIVLFAAALVTFAGCSCHRPLPSCIMNDIPYGPDKENTMDISLPEGRTADTPIIILVHGGAWTGGDKGNFSYMRGYFFDRGFAAFSVNYRLARIPDTGFRNILDDMVNVLTFVKEKSGIWTYSHDTIFLAGHSAGGHIVLLYSFTRAPEKTIRGIVSYCGLSDLTDSELEMYLLRMQQNDADPAKRSFDRIRFLAGPDRKMRMVYSPVFFTRDIPVLLFCGKKDTIVPCSQSEKLHRKMKERGFDSSLYVYPDMGHDISPHYEKIMNITEQWLRERM